MGINYDPASVLYYRGVRPERDLAQIAARVIHVHLKDQRDGQDSLDFSPLGEGTVDFPALVQTLAQAGHAGPYSAESKIKGVGRPGGGRRGAAAESALYGGPYRVIGEVQARLARIPGVGLL